MSRRTLPILNYASFRRYPTKLGDQEFTDDKEVCHHCLSGVCCSMEDAIALTSIDIFRLAAFFNLSPAEFMLKFTQDKFGGNDDQRYRRESNNNPNTSVVTWLRRRANLSSSPCIFLKYVREPDGTPHRICSVHDARPLSCREYYFTGCKTRGTGELASLLAEGFEKVRDGAITEEMVDSELARFGHHDFGTSTLADNMAYSFWIEMKCVLNMDQANIEGANSYDLTDYQDPIDEKLNRVLSAKYLRWEESYGPRPRDEQLMPYTSGLSFTGSPEYERIMKVVQTPPSSGLFAVGSYPNYVGVRTMVPGVRYADLFPVIPNIEINAFLDNLPSVRPFQHHPLQEVRRIKLRDVYGSVLMAYNHLIRLASHITSLEPILECDPPGTIETKLFTMVIEFETNLNPYIANNPYFQTVKQHMAKAAVELLEEEVATATTPEEVFNCLRSLTVLKVAITTLSLDIQTRVKAIDSIVRQRLRKDNLDLYISTDNQVEIRRAAGKPLGLNRCRRAWDLWHRSALDMRVAAFAGFDRIDLTTFYQQSVDDIEKLPFRRNYVAGLCEIVKCLSQSMTFNHRIPYEEMPYKDAADKLATYALRLFNRLEEEEERDCQTITALASAIHMGPGLSYNQVRNLGLITHRLLNGQLPDGSWETNPRAEDPPNSQAEYLEMMYRPTWACINALRLALIC